MLGSYGGLYTDIPERHGKSGQTTMSFEWTPKQQKSPRVPYENRLLLAQLIGPDLVAGRYFELTPYKQVAAP